MEQLDKWEKELQQLSDFAEDATNKKLFKHYRQALIDIKKELKAFMENYENLSFSKRLGAERLLENGKQIDAILRETYKQSNSTIEKYTHGEAERGYYGTWYTLEGANNIQLDMYMLPEKYIKELVHHPVKGKVFSKRLYKHHNKLAKQVTASMLDAARKGKSYAVAAKGISDMTEATYKQALRIARTEGGRVQSTAKQRSYFEAKKKGVDLEKRWLSTLDGHTRHSHQHLDGQTVAIDEQFESENGYTADGPRLFGVAKEDVNCRCTTITVVNGVAPDLRRDNVGGKDFPYKNYNEWYNKKTGKSKQSGKDELEKTSKRIKQLEGAMEKMEDGDFGDLSEEEAEDLYDKYDAELESLKAHKKKLISDNNIYQNVPENEIDSFFNTQEGYRKWQSSLTDYDKKNIDDYTGTRYKVINKIKRDGAQSYLDEPMYRGSPQEWKESMIKQANDLTGSIDGYITERPFISYRKFNKPQDYIDLTSGDVGEIKVLDKGYMSTSLKQSTTDEFGSEVSYEIRVGKGKNVGVYVGENSHHKNEKEFLFKPGTKFKVLDVKNTIDQNQKFQHIILEVME